MNTSRLVYRSRQFWQTITARSSTDDLELVSSVLSPTQFELFKLMQKSEQIHSLRVLKTLKNMGHENIDLQTAALLHDVGKIRAPLRSWERALIVVAKALCQDCVRRWGSAPIEDTISTLGWRRAFIVAEQHPAWGAALATQCGTSEMAVSLIARHQEQLQPEDVNESSEEDRLLRILQAVDNIS
jgi:putative nucleotidyltransferase with HDIG domain